MQLFYAVILGKAKKKPTAKINQQNLRPNKLYVLFAVYITNERTRSRLYKEKKPENS